MIADIKHLTNSINYSELIKYCWLHKRVFHPKDKGSLSLVDDATNLSQGYFQPKMKWVYWISLIKMNQGGWFIKVGVLGGELVYSNEVSMMNMSLIVDTYFSDMSSNNNL